MLLLRLRLLRRWRRLHTARDAPLCITSRAELKCALLLIYVAPTGRRTKAFSGAARRSAERASEREDAGVYGTIDYTFSVVLPQFYPL